MIKSSTESTLIVEAGKNIIGMLTILIGILQLVENCCWISQICRLSVCPFGKPVDLIYSYLTFYYLIKDAWNYIISHRSF